MSCFSAIVVWIFSLFGGSPECDLTAHGPRSDGLEARCEVPSACSGRCAQRPPPPPEEDWEVVTVVDGPDAISNGF